MSTESRKVGQQIRRVAREDIKRIHQNILTHKPWWLPKFLWSRIVASVLENRE